MVTTGKAAFLAKIIEFALCRHKKQTKNYVVKLDPVRGPLPTSLTYSSFDFLT